ncbi:DNA repair protein RadA [Clostridia bacterium]|nr:DNA repair protein RadA [Clostridia bacterium]
MPKLKTVYICSECGHEASSWVGRCPMCKSFNTMVEDVKDVSPQKAAPSASRAFSNENGGAISNLANIKRGTEKRVKTNISELDRALSGGIVNGSLILIGGEPGIGKSTILLQICDSADYDGTILYVSGEESLSQIKMRADRLNIEAENLLLLAETDVSAIETVIASVKPVLVIVDSIQTMYTQAANGTAGSVTQIRECASFFMRVAKGSGVSVILVGHVTKEGTLAGPRILEHMVDAVLYFEGEKRASYRLIRAVKNRFGATDEIGVFEMSETGLKSIANPSEYMLAGRPLNAPGSVVSCAVEGTRAILAEVQALVCQTAYGNPRRAASGVDFNRVVMLIAAMERRVGASLSSFDTYINIVGGMKILEPAMDLAVVAALSSSYKNRPANQGLIMFGEVGLTGEVRAVNMAEKRVAEAAKLGFTECALPQSNVKGLKVPKSIRVFGVSAISEMLEILY